MASFIIPQLVEQFWSVNLVTAAFGVRIPNISNWDITKVHLLENHTYFGINISTWHQHDLWCSSEKIEDVLLFARVSHVETFVTSWEPWAYSQNLFSFQSYWRYARLCKKFVCVGVRHPIHLQHKQFNCRSILWAACSLRQAPIQ
jgi:hypothetical protein